MERNTIKWNLCRLHSIQRETKLLHATRKISARNDFQLENLIYIHSKLIKQNQKTNIGEKRAGY